MSAVVRIQVDFNAMTDAGVVPALARGNDLRVGDRVIAFDDDTDDYDGLVVEIRGRTLLIRVEDQPRPSGDAASAQPVTGEASDTGE